MPRRGKKSPMDISMDPVLQDYNVSTSLEDINRDAMPPSDSSLFERIADFECDLPDVTLNNTDSINVSSGPYPPDSTIVDLEKQTRSVFKKPFNARTRPKRAKPRPSLFESDIKDSETESPEVKVRRPFQRKTKPLAVVNCFDIDSSNESFNSPMPAPSKFITRRKTRNKKYIENVSFDKDLISSESDTSFKKPVLSKRKMKCKEVNSAMFDDVFHDTLNETQSDTSFSQQVAFKSLKKRETNVDPNLFDSALNSSDSLQQSLNTTPTDICNDKHPILVENDQCQDVKENSVSLEVKDNISEEINDKDYTLQVSEEISSCSNTLNCIENNHINIQTAEIEGTYLVNNSVRNDTSERAKEKVYSTSENNENVKENCESLVVKGNTSEEINDKDITLQVSKEISSSSNTLNCIENNHINIQTAEIEGTYLVNNSARNDTSERAKENVYSTSENNENDKDITLQVSKEISSSSNTLNCIENNHTNTKTTEIGGIYLVNNSIRNDTSARSEVSVNSTFENDENSIPSKEKEHNSKLFEEVSKTEQIGMAVIDKDVNISTSSKVEENEMSYSKNVGHENKVTDTSLKSPRYHWKSSDPVKVTETSNNLSLQNQNILNKNMSTENVSCENVERIEQNCDFGVVDNKQVNSNLNYIAEDKAISMSNNLSEGDISISEDERVSKTITKIPEDDGRCYSECNENADIMDSHISETNKTSLMNTSVIRSEIGFNVISQERISILASRRKSSLKRTTLDVSTNRNGYGNEKRVSFDLRNEIQPELTPNSSLNEENTSQINAGFSFDSLVMKSSFGDVNSESEFIDIHPSKSKSSSYSLNVDFSTAHSNKIQKESESKTISITSKHDNTSDDDEHECLEEQMITDVEKVEENTLNIKDNTDDEVENEEEEEPEVEEEDEEVEEEEEEVEEEEEEEEEEEVDEEGENEIGESTIGRSEKTNTIGAIVGSNASSEENESVLQRDSIESQEYLPAQNENSQSDCNGKVEPQNLSKNKQKKSTVHNAFKVPQPVPLTKRKLQRILDKIPISELKKKRKKVIPDLTREQIQQNEIDEALTKRKKQGSLLTKRPSNKLKMPKKWVAPGIYDLIIEKLKCRYGIRSHVQAEKVVLNLVENVGRVVKTNDEYFSIVDEIKKELASLGIVNTHWEFYRLASRYFTGDFFDKVYMSGFKNPYEPDNIFETIL